MAKGDKFCYDCGGSGWDYSYMAMPSGFALKCKTCEGTRECTEEDNKRYLERHQYDGENGLALFVMVIVAAIIVFCVYFFSH
jgi:hypothetical protein